MAVSKLNPSAGGIPYGDNAGRPANPETGKLYSNGEEKRLELYTSSGWQNIVSETPGVVSVSGNYLESVGSATLEVTGTNFTTGAIASLIGTNGVEVQAGSTTVNSIVSITATFSGLSAEHEPYDLKVTNTSNLFGLLPDALYINQSPIWVTSAGSLGTFNEQVSITLSALSATDPESTTISYSLASGSSLPSGVSLNSSTGVISGTLPDIAANTTYTFSVNASDGLNVIPRTFSISSIAYSIVTSGLQVFWDPATSASYSGSGTSINNIAPNGSTHTGTLQDGVSYTVASNNGSYFTFDGVNDNIVNTSYSNSTTGVGTLIAWIYPTAINSGLNYYACVGSPTGTGQARSIAANSSGWYFVSNGSSAQDQLIASQTLNTWQQIAIVFNGTSIKWYINTTEYAYTKSGVVNPGSSNIRLGEALWGTENAPCRMGPVAVYDTALTAENIANNYNTFKGRYGL